jgi:hypothetical protein
MAASLSYAQILAKSNNSEESEDAINVRTATVEKSQISESATTLPRNYGRNQRSLGNNVFTVQLRSIISNSYEITKQA